ncbi:disulfide bond formation protein DsbD, partial [Odoribacter sp. OttesenSCG-928-A06]|nr:disulfide bond formation protein DsbD [Odoribacter sp. OttesenSCG-928-A06]
EPKILEILKNDYVILALHVDNRKKLPESEWYTGGDGKIKKTLGKKNADFQITHFHSNAQPNYILLDSHYESGEMSAYQLMPARAYSMDKEAFYQFLKDGVEEFKKR